MRVRKLDANGDMTFGSMSDYWVDVPDAVAQVVSTRLRLWKGQWFLNANDGFDWQKDVLGKYTDATRDAALQLAILQSPGVQNIPSYSSSLDRNTRRWGVAGTSINTIYGSITLPGPQ